MSTLLATLRNLVAAFDRIHGDYATSLDGVVGTLGGFAFNAPFGDLVSLAFAINDTRDGLTADSTPTRAQFDAALDLTRLQSLEDERVRRTRPVATAATRLIGALRGAEVIAAFDAAPALERLEILSGLARILPWLDLHDPRKVGGAVTGSTEARFLMDVARGRPSILMPGRLSAMIRDLPEITVTGSVATLEMDDTARAFFRRQQGGDTPDDALKWTTFALAQSAGLVTAILSVPHLREPASQVLVDHYLKLQIGIDRAADGAGPVNPVVRLGQIGDDLTELGLRPATPGGRLFRAKVVLDTAGLPFSFFDGLVKTQLALIGALNATDPRQAGLLAAQGVGEGIKLMAAAVELRGATSALRSTAGRVGAVIAVPLLAVELQTAAKGLQDARQAGDLSVAIGNGLMGISATGAVLFGLYAKFAVAAAAAGPVGLGAALAGGLLVTITVLGIYLVEFTKDPKLETFAHQCIFGRGFADFTALNPDQVAFGFGTPAAPRVALMLERLRSLQAPIGFATEAPTLPGVYSLTHALTEGGPAAAAGRSFRSTARTAVQHLGSAPREGGAPPPLPNFDDPIFRRTGQTLIYGPGASDTPPSWERGWLRLQIT
ncbi:hypothetical protein E4191_00705 [Paracoccus liaowanqingii]|uniref:Uncharacterized protein n=1 Tax=Paracoccus liaowanqingii TaxID=2560053 RepID=A0A4V1BIJ0_9RHOB|nr:hypothetical protein [Paracoccus liaowanqingii]QBX33399.1 hypothetical protein E4191_00705 [Paracoccus liaowanqingii]